ncbi:hypothetical protein F4777DRAFT_588952 [Nemania sp. FL0916]|nr:hypothetical protein F4777DRAFT_588952 [Nemania sp. FL0916]
MIHSWTLGDGTFDAIPQDRRRRQDVPYPTYVDYAYRSRAALTSLQISSQAPISMTSLDIALDHLWKCLPEDVRHNLCIDLPNGPALWGESEDAKTAMYTKMSDDAYQVPVRGTNGKEYINFSRIRGVPWVIWPLWVEDKWGRDFVTVIWYAQSSDDNNNRYDRLVSYGIIDPRRSPDSDRGGRHRPIKDRSDRIQRRLLEFWRLAGYNVDNAQVMMLFSSPMPLDESTSGERCFAAVKGLLEQIIKWYVSGKNYNGMTITSQSQWVNPFQQRVEMTGICAWILMASLDYNARVTVEAILPNSQIEIASDGKKRYVYPYDLCGPYDEPPIAPRDYLLPADDQSRGLAMTT